MPRADSPQQAFFPAEIKEAPRDYEDVSQRSRGMKRSTTKTNLGSFQFEEFTSTSKKCDSAMEHELKNLSALEKEFCSSTSTLKNDASTDDLLSVNQQKTFIARKTLGIFLELSKMCKSLPEADLAKIEEVTVLESSSISEIENAKKRVELTFDSGLLKQAQLYCSWWSTAHAVSGVDVLSNLLEDMKKWMSEQPAYSRHQRVIDEAHNTTYTIPQMYRHEKAVVGTYIHPSIVPGFLYRVRMNSPSRSLFGGKALHLTSLGMGMGKRIHFDGEMFGNENYFWSDSNPTGYAFAISAVERGDKMAVLDNDLEVLASIEVIHVDEAQFEKASKVYNREDVIVMNSEVELVQDCSYHRKDVQVRTFCNVTFEKKESVPVHMRGTTFQNIEVSGRAVVIKKLGKEHRSAKQELLGIVNVKFHGENKLNLDYLACVNHSLM
eukprot:Nk52_evm6s360 gene=Nk52_evmTU6s360